MWNQLKGAAATFYYRNRNPELWRAGERVAEGRFEAMLEEGISPPTPQNHQEMQAFIDREVHILIMHVGLGTLPYSKDEVQDPSFNGGWLRRMIELATKHYYYGG